MINSNKKINFVNNLRDLGNKKTQTNNTIRDNLFIRCAAPINLSTEAQKQLISNKDSLIIDFRGVNEAKKNPTILPKELLKNRVHLPVEPKVTELLKELNKGTAQKTDLNEIFKEAYRKYTIENLDTFKEFFKILFKNSGSRIIFHCTAGKDRTGFAAALILSLFGVSQRYIFEDYMLSNEQYKPTEKVTREVNQIGVKELLKVDETWLDAGLQEFQRQAGDVIDFNIFQNFLTDYFNVSSFNGTEPTLCYLEEFNIYVGFDQKNFVAAFSPEKSFAVNKIKSFFNSENPIINNKELTNYLSQDDDLSFYLSTENLLEFLNGINNPFLKMQIPNLYPIKEYGSSLSMALNFNVGNCTLSLKSNSDNLTNQLYANNGVEEKYKTFLTDNNQLVMFGFLNVMTENISNQLIQLEKLGILDDFSQVLNSIGTNPSGLMNIIDGQFSFSFIEFPKNLLKEVEDSFVYNEEDEEYWSDEEFSEDLMTNSSQINTSLPSFIASLGIEDVKEFTSLLNKNNISIVHDSVMDLKLGICFLYKNKVFHLSSNKDLLEKITQNGGLNQYVTLDDKCLNQPFYGCVEFNLDDWPKDIVTQMFKNTDSQVFFKDIKKVIVNANNKEGLLKVQMKNEDQNALKTIIYSVSYLKDQGIDSLNDE